MKKVIHVYRLYIYVTEIQQYEYDEILINNCMTWHALKFKSTKETELKIIDTF